MKKLMLNFIKIFVFVLTSFFVFNCSSSEKSHVSGKSTMKNRKAAFEKYISNYTKLKAGEKNVLSKGRKYAVVLDSSAGTGYNWFFPKKSKGMVVKKEKKNFYVAPKHYVGGKQKTVIVLQAKKTGNEKITFLYYQPWRGEKNTEKQKTFPVVVE